MDIETRALLDVMSTECTRMEINLRVHHQAVAPQGAFIDLGACDFTAGGPYCDEQFFSDLAAGVRSLWSSGVIEHADPEKLASLAKLLAGMLPADNWIAHTRLESGDGWKIVSELQQLCEVVPPIEGASIDTANSIRSVLASLRTHAAELLETIRSGQL